MKILNVMRRLSFEEWGGTESAVWNASKCLIKDGCEVEICATSALCPTPFEERSGIKISRYPYFYPHLFLSAQDRAILDKKGGNPFSFGLYRHLLNTPFDILHTHAMGRLAKLCIKAAHCKNVPSVISFHGGHYDVPQSEFDEMAKPLRGKLGYGRLIEKALGLDFDIVERADGIICVGPNEKLEIEKRFPGKPCAHIPNGVDWRKFAKTPAFDFRKAYNIAPQKKLILCVSRIDYQKNQRAFVPLLKELAARGLEAHCAIVGFVTSKSYFEALKEDIAQAGMQNSFTLIEGLPPDSDELLSAYKSADLFMLPSVHEPFGIVALEAWAAGLPVAASDVGGLKTLVEDGRTGYLFDAFSADSMAQAALNALANAPQITQNALCTVKEKYSWEAVADLIKNFYGELRDAQKRR